MGDNVDSNLPSLLRSSQLIGPEMNAAEDAGIVDVVCDLLPRGVVKSYSGSDWTGEVNRETGRPIYVLEHSTRCA